MAEHTHDHCLQDEKPLDSEIEAGLLYEGPAGALSARAAAAKLPDPTNHIRLSPNYTAGMPSGGWQGITVHDEEGYDGPSIDWLCNPQAQASAHFVIRKDGYITQLVYETNRAWHAQSSGMLYLGIEHEGFASRPFWTTPKDAAELRADDAMLQASARLSAYLCTKYSIPIQHDLTTPPPQRHHLAHSGT